MEMLIDKKLKTEIGDTGEKFIQIYTQICGGWAGTFVNVLARFVSKEDAEELKRSGYYCKEQDGIEVLIPRRGISVNDKVYLGLTKFLWAKNIIVRGMTAV